MESFFGNPWDFGTGFTQPPTFAPGTGTMPVQPQFGLPEAFANGMAAQGIRPQQFFQNPEVARDVIQPPAPQAAESPWDATPVSMPGGAAAPLVPNNPAVQPNAQTPLGTDASAAGSPMDATKKEKPFGEKLAETLKGVKMPVPPTPQKVGTPGAPHPSGSIKTGELLSMLLSMQPGGAQQGMQLPQTLGSALQGVYRNTVAPRVER